MSRARGADARGTVSPGEVNTTERILEGALRAVARRGLHKVSMSDIGDSAAVSRGTLYRYFASRDDVLAALPDYILREFEQRLRNAIAEHPDPQDRLRVVLEAIVDYAESAPETRELIESEPEFGLRFLERNLPGTVRVVTDALEPVIEDAAVVQARVITGPELAEIVVRIGMSGFLVRGTRTRQLPRRVADVWAFLTSGQSGQAAEPARPDTIASVAQLSSTRRRQRA